MPISQGQQTANPTHMLLTKCLEECRLFRKTKTDYEERCSLGVVYQKKKKNNNTMPRTGFHI